MTTGTDSFVRETRVERTEYEIDVACAPFVELNLSNYIVNQLRSFNQKPYEMRSAIIECARRIEKSVPAKVRQALEGSPMQPPVQLTEWKKQTVITAAEMEALMPYGEDLREQHSKETDPGRRTSIERQATAMGFVLYPKADPLAVPWDDKEVRVRTLCLVDLKTGFPVIQKSILYPTYGGNVQRSGNCWKFEVLNRNLDDTMGIDISYGPSADRAVPISKESFRLPHFLEIVAMLCPVTEVNHLPIIFVE